MMREENRMIWKRDRVKDFCKFLDRNLPNGYCRAFTDKCDVEIRDRNNEYVYVFYRGEIIEKFEDCCGLALTVVNLVRKDCYV
jgi:hypothetical protein